MSVRIHSAALPRAVVLAARPPESAQPSPIQARRGGFELSPQAVRPAVSPTMALPAAGYGRLPFLKRGDEGPWVGILKRALRDQGAFDLEPGTSFGPKTEAAVRTLQANGRRRFGRISVDGRVGGQTWGLVLPTVREGDEGPWVDLLRRMLAARGHTPVVVAGSPMSEHDVTIVQNFQAGGGLDDDGIAGRNTWEALARQPSGRAQPTLHSIPLAHTTTVVSDPYSTMDFMGMVNFTAENESGHRGYAAVTWNDFDAGISYGRFQFNQKWGALGQLFERMWEADPKRFVELTYGDSAANSNPERLAARLIGELNGRDPDSFRWGVEGDPSTNTDPRLMRPLALLDHQIARRLGGSLSGRLADPNDRHLWSRRLKALAEEPAFQQIQMELAIEQYFMPVLAKAEETGLTSTRAIALMFDMSIQLGPNKFGRYVDRKLRSRLGDAWRAATPDEKPYLEHELLWAIGESSWSFLSNTAMREITRRRRIDILETPELGDVGWTGFEEEGFEVAVSDIVPDFAGSGGEHVIPIG